MWRRILTPMWVSCCKGCRRPIDQSDRFLWDLRRRIADRIATEYVGGLREKSEEAGLKMWLENYGHWGFPSEFLRYGGESDLLAGEFWANGDYLHSMDYLGAIESRDSFCPSSLTGPIGLAPFSRA